MSLEVEDRTLSLHNECALTLRTGRLDGPLQVLSVLRFDGSASDLLPSAADALVAAWLHGTQRDLYAAAQGQERLARRYAAADSRMGRAQVLRRSP